MPQRIGLAHAIGSKSPSISTTGNGTREESFNTPCSLQESSRTVSGGKDPAGKRDEDHPTHNPFTAKQRNREHLKGVRGPKIAGKH
ncbi:UNVERIFIED_CONTAM: hypothetical protein K2H54_047651 [Gekko kuhli]